jgi:hypothetical protein
MFNLLYRVKNLFPCFSLLVVLFFFLTIETGAQVPEATSGFQVPLIGTYSNNGGNQFLTDIGSGQFHPGEDWNQPTLNGGCATGCDVDMCLDVVASATGKVVYANTSSGSWCGVVIQHNYQGQTWYSQYGHIINIQVTNNQNVTKGQKIAEIGKVQTTCAHLHFEIRESDHPAATNGAYYSNLTYSNVVNWYEDPDSFIPSHPAYNPGVVNCTFAVNGNHSLDGWKFWKKPPMPANFYNVTMDITGLAGGHWALYILRPNGTIISDVRLDRTESHYVFEFHVDSGNVNYPNLGGYRFKLTPQGQSGTQWALSDAFYISDPPKLEINISPYPVIYIGNTATLTWNTTGGIPGLPNGGWTEKIRFQWYQNGVAKRNLDSTLVANGTFPFTVPSSIPECTVPGTNFTIGAANSDIGTSMPGGLVSDFTPPFSIQYPIGLSQNQTEVPLKFELFQNYPNPFNPNTQIMFSIPKSTHVMLKIYDVNGRQVIELLDQHLEPASYTYSFDGSNLSSGIYIYSLETETFTDRKKMILVK